MSSACQRIVFRNAQKNEITNSGKVPRGNLIGVIPKIRRMQVEGVSFPDSNGPQMELLMHSIKLKVQLDITTLFCWHFVWITSSAHLNSPLIGWQGASDLTHQWSNTSARQMAWIKGINLEWKTKGVCFLSWHQPAFEITKDHRSAISILARHLPPASIPRSPVCGESLPC